MKRLLFPVLVLLLALAAMATRISTPTQVLVCDLCGKTAQLSPRVLPSREVLWDLPPGWSEKTNFGHVCDALDAAHAAVRTDAGPARVIDAGPVPLLIPAN